MLQPVHVAGSSPPLFEPVREDRRPRVDRRIHVTEGPFVGGHLPVGVQVRSESIRLSCCFAKSGSTRAKANA